MIKKTLLWIGFLGFTSVTPAFTSTQVEVTHLELGADLAPMLERQIPFDVSITSKVFPKSVDALSEWIAFMSDLSVEKLSSDSFDHEPKTLFVRVSFYPAEGVKKAPAVLMAHPTGGDHEHLNALSEILKKHGYHVLCPHSEEARGAQKVGQRQNSQSILSTCTDLIETMKVFGVYEDYFDGFHILGMSRGAVVAHFLTHGQIVDHMMRGAPEGALIRSLILVASQPVIQMTDENYQKPPFPIIYMHGTDDGYVRPQATFNYAKRIGATWIPIEGGGHGLWKNEDKETRHAQAEDWSKFAWVLDRPWSSFTTSKTTINGLMENLFSEKSWFLPISDDPYIGDEALKLQLIYEKEHGCKLIPRYSDLMKIYSQTITRGVSMMSSKGGYAFFIEALLRDLKEH